MPSHRIAYGKGVNQLGATQYVILRKQTSGTDQVTEFHLGPDGFTMTFEGPSDTQLLPGIWTRTVEVTTIWTNTARLESFLTDLAAGSDGLFLLEIAGGLAGAPTFYGIVLPEAITVADQYDNVQVTLRATDGLALLKNTKYNDDGEPYTDHDTILGHLKKVQSKLLHYDRISDTSGNWTRFSIHEGIVSVDDELYTAHPPSNTSGTPKRMRVHHRTFHKKNNDGVNEYYSAYDVLNSICQTFNCCAFIYNRTIYMVPPANQSGAWTTRNYGSNDTETVTSFDYTIPFNGALSVYNNVKAANWSRTFTPPAGDVLLTRNAQTSQGVIYSTNEPSGTALNDTLETYKDLDELVVRGSFRIQKDGDNTLTGSNRLYRFAPVFKIRLGEDGQTQYYYNNVVVASESPIMTAVLNEDTAYQNTVQYHHLTLPRLSNGEFFQWTTATTNNEYVYRTPMPDGRFWALHDAQGDIDAVIPFEFTFKLINPGVGNGLLGDQKGMQITPRVIAYNSSGVADSDYLDDATVTFVELGVYRRSKGEAVETDTFKYRASTDSGRSELDLGQTLIGDRGATTYFGGIEVYDGSDWVSSSGWVTKDQSTPRTINQIPVEEVCAYHKRTKLIQQGTVIQNGTFWTLQTPGARWKDINDDKVYVALRYVERFTPATFDVTLFTVGRNFVDIDVYIDDKKGDVNSQFVKPSHNDINSVDFQNGRLDYLQSYHTRAAEIADLWDSADVIDGATLEYYYTVNVDGVGVWANHQGQVAPSNYKIVRKVYIAGLALADGDDTFTSPSGAQPLDNASLQTTIEKFQEHIAKLTNAKAAYTIIVSYSEVSLSTDLLDVYSGGEAAYSLRKLRADYTGAAINVRRTSPTSASQDIGFTASGDLDVGALSTFCGSGDGFVQTWYDQSGNGRNATQTSQTLQPKIFSSGFTLYVNSKPAVYFDGDYLDTASFAPNPDGEVNAAAVVQFDSVSSRQSAASQWGSSSGQQNFFFQMQEVVVGLRFGWRYGGGTLVYEDQVATATADTQYLMSATFETGDVEVLYNGVAGSQTNTPGGGQTPNNHSRVMRLGGLSTNTTQLMSGYIQEWVIWSNATAHTNSDIDDDINDYYSVY